MEPLSRVAFEYPIYAMQVLSDGSVAVAGGGGRMKSGIPNACEVLGFDARTNTLRRSAAASLSDAPIALAATTATASGSVTLVAVVSTGCKNFVYDPPSALAPASSFAHDLQVSSTAEQSAVAISANSARLAVASDEGHLTVLELPHYTPLFSKLVHAQGVIDLTINAEGTRVATTARDRTAFIIDAASADIIQSVAPAMPLALGTHVRAIRFTMNDPALIFTAESHPRKGGWIAARRSSDPDFGNWQTVASIKASVDALTAFTINDSASVAAVSSAEGHVVVFRWNGSSFSRTWTTEPRLKFLKPPQPPHVLPVTSMRFAKTGSYLFTSSADYTVALWPTRRPTNWKFVTRVAFWITSIVVALLTVLIAEDHHLSDALVHRRNAVQPYLEPHLSQIQARARPALQQGLEELQPYFVQIHTAAQPHIQHARKKADPALRTVDEYWQAWAPVLSERRHQATRLARSSVDVAGSSAQLALEKMRDASDLVRSKMKRMRTSRAPSAEANSSRDADDDPSLQAGQVPPSSPEHTQVVSEGSGDVSSSSQSKSVVDTVDSLIDSDMEPVVKGDMKPVDDDSVEPPFDGDAESISNTELGSAPDDEVQIGKTAADSTFHDDDSSTVDNGAESPPGGIGDSVGDDAGAPSSESDDGSVHEEHVRVVADKQVVFTSDDAVASTSEDDGESIAIDGIEFAATDGIPNAAKDNIAIMDGDDGAGLAGDDVMPIVGENDAAAVGDDVVPVVGNDNIKIVDEDAQSTHETNNAISPDGNVESVVDDEVTFVGDDSVGSAIDIGIRSDVEDEVGSAEGYDAESVADDVDEPSPHSSDNAPIDDDVEPVVMGGAYPVREEAVMPIIDDNARPDTSDDSKPISDDYGSSDLDFDLDLDPGLDLGRNSRRQAPVQLPPVLLPPPPHEPTANIEPPARLSKFRFQLPRKLASMVSTRSTRNPPAPSADDVASARLLADDPPPLSAAPTSPQTPTKSPQQPLPIEPTTDGIDDDDSDAPEEQPSSAAAASARAQLRLERETRDAVREERRARQRARRSLEERAAEDRRRRSRDLGAEEGRTQTAQGGAKDEDAAEGASEEGGDGADAGVEELPLMLPEGVLQAAAGEVLKKREGEKARRKEERLRKQRGVVGKKLAVKELLGGVQVAVVGRYQGGRPPRQKGNRDTAAAFLRHSLRDGGVNRVSAAKAIRIASKRKIVE